MSSTHRGAERNEKDYYVTPIPEVVKFLKAIDTDIPDLVTKLCGKILDPAAGGTVEPDGEGDYKVIIPASYPEALRQCRFSTDNLMTMDIRENADARYCQDFLAWGSKTVIEPEFDVVITNPPFSIAIPFIEKALKHTKPGGYVIMLQRLNFYGSKERFDFWQHYMPVYTYVHSKRMGFSPDGRTDSIEYAHYIWQKDNYPKYSSLRVI